MYTITSNAIYCTCLLSIYSCFIKKLVAHNKSFEITYHFTFTVYTCVHITPYHTAVENAGIMTNESRAYKNAEVFSHGLDILICGGFQ